MKVIIELSDNSVAAACLAANPEIDIKKFLQKLPDEVTITTSLYKKAGIADKDLHTMEQALAASTLPLAYDFDKNEFIQPSDKQHHEQPHPSPRISFRTDYGTRNRTRTTAFQNRRRRPPP